MSPDTVNPTEPLRVIVISSVSGAGRSTAEVAFEDQGYYSISNLPITLWSTAVQQVLDSRQQQMDASAKDSSDDLTEEPGPPIAGLVLSIYSNPALTDTTRIQSALEALRKWAALNLVHVHLVCDDDALVRRFSATRRRHPFATDRPLLDGISAEKSFLAPLRLSADVVLDTTLMAPKELALHMRSFVPPVEQTSLVVGVSSFAFGRGVPREADLVFDARFLRNPHYVAELRELTGRDKRVSAYVQEDPDYKAFVGHIMDMLQLCLPRFEKDGKSYLTIAIGCTGGKHRSVTIAEDLARRLSGDLNYATSLRHRES